MIQLNEAENTHWGAGSSAGVLDALLVWVSGRNLLMGGRVCIYLANLQI
jgi:hypothetical protein